ncbi:MAG: capsule assembly Wzi family protein [Deltaproteobacteria bacterium]
MSLFGLDLMAGKDSQWWGPGYHGSILLSNNSEPLEFVRLTNPEPVVLPWIFKYIGPIRAAFFAGRLEKNRSDFSEPILWGLNVNFKPVSYLELGLERTAIMGGKGRSESLATWWRSFTGVGENDGRESGDQRAGYYAKLTLPFKWQPVQFYVEADGEDQRNSFPSKWAYLAGIYLPKIAGLERFDLRGEFSTNHIGEYPNVWYSHHIYTQGYTYKGRIIGHHMGSDSKDIFVEASYLIPGSYGRISLSYDREEHNTSLAVREKKDEIELKGIIQLVKGLELKAMYGFGSVKNVGNVPSDRQLINIFAAELMYRF